MGAARAFLRELLTVPDALVPTGNIVQFLEEHSASSERDMDMSDDEGDGEDRAEVFAVVHFPMRAPDDLVESVLNRERVEIVMIAARGNDMTEVARVLIAVEASRISVDTIVDGIEEHLFYISR